MTTPVPPAAGLAGVARAGAGKGIVTTTEVARNQEEGMMSEEYDRRMTTEELLSKVRVLRGAIAAGRVEYDPKLARILLQLAEEIKRDVSEPPPTS
jgi:hypothetical protein